MDDHLTLSKHHHHRHAERGKEIVTVVNPDIIRLGHVWVPADLRWYRRRVTLNLLRQVGVTGAAAHKAVDVSRPPCMGGAWAAKQGA